MRAYVCTYVCVYMRTRAHPYICSVFKTIYIYTDLEVYIYIYTVPTYDDSTYDFLIDDAKEIHIQGKPSFGF